MLTYLYQYLGISIYYAESIEKIGENLKEVKPQMFSTVPRLLEKVFDKIVAKGNEQKGLKKSIFFWALRLGLRYEFNSKNGLWYDIQLYFARKLVFSKWREALGNNLKVVASGGAALQVRLARVFWAAGIPILEGYGLTETSPVISVNTLDPGGAMFGSVGRPIPEVIVKIAPGDGEILVKGPNIMKGYYNREDLTRDAIDDDGWFHTGDIGILDNGFLKITDRKKEIFKTSGGKYIAPQVIENKLKESIYIEQVMVVGENERFPAALVVPAFINLKEYCIENKIEYTGDESIIENLKIKELVKSEIDLLNESLGQTEKIKSFRLVSKEWTIDSGELTPTLKVRRKTISERYSSLIQDIYKNHQNDKLQTPDSEIGG
jgi:long-chain acyl-CoA synthetase